MLNLKEFKTMNKQFNDYYYLFNIEAKDKPTVCPMWLVKNLDMSRVVEAAIIVIQIYFLIYVIKQILGGK